MQPTDTKKSLNGMNVRAIAEVIKGTKGKASKITKVHNYNRQRYKLLISF